MCSGFILAKSQKLCHFCPSNTVRPTLRHSFISNAALSQRYCQQLKLIFEKVTNILGDQISKENLVYCFFGDRISIERQKLFSSISILSVRHHENIPDKLKINNLYFMIFIVQINKVPKII